jgi:DnaJ-class molecular chaperone
MADGYKLWTVCHLCDGTGITGDEGSEDRNCTLCKGKKYIFGGWCSVDTSTLPTNLPDAP